MISQKPKKTLETPAYYKEAPLNIPTDLSPDSSEYQEHMRQIIQGNAGKTVLLQDRASTSSFLVLGKIEIGNVFDNKHYHLRTFNPKTQRLKLQYRNLTRLLVPTS